MILEPHSKNKKILLIIAVILVIMGLIFLMLPESGGIETDIPESPEPSSFKSDHLEKSISRYLLTQRSFSWQTREDSFNFCSAENLEPENDLFPFYIWAYCAEYIVEDGELKALSGSSGPVKIDYPNELSYYDNSKFSYEAPGDGAAYTQDIKRIFPQSLHEKVFNFDRENIIRRNEELALSNILSWELIKRAVANCEAEQVFQAHSRDVVVKLKNGEEIGAVEPMIDDIIDIALEAEPKCGRIIMATE